MRNKSKHTDINTQHTYTHCLQEPLNAHRCFAAATQDYFALLDCVRSVLLQVKAYVFRVSQAELRTCSLACFCCCCCWHNALVKLLQIACRLSCCSWCVCGKQVLTLLNAHLTGVACSPPPLWAAILLSSTICVLYFMLKWAQYDFVQHQSLTSVWQDS